MTFGFIFVILLISYFEVAHSNITLACYDCEETFEERWDPYTDCQIYPKNTPIKPCLEHEVYCLVERITVKGMTTSIKRRCTEECYYGCRAHNFGLTTMTCTSCCQNPGCNTDSSAATLCTRIYVFIYCWLTLFVLKVK